MMKRISPGETRVWFAGHMKQRLDYGLGKAVAGLMLHPRNPFNPKERRKWRGSFLWAVAWLGTAVVAFVYFNFA